MLMWLKTQAGHSVNTNNLKRIEVVQRQVPAGYSIEAQTKDDRMETLVQGTVDECQRIHIFILGEMNGNRDPASWELGAILAGIRHRPS
jgi:hypothetical protein